jgi:hypothetical protein
MIINEPWQKNPAELIQSAIRHLHERWRADLRKKGKILDERSRKK